MDYITNLWYEYDDLVINFGIALLILVATYIGARFLAALVKKLLHNTELDNKFTRTVGLREDFPIEGIVSGVIFWVIMLFGVVSALETLSLDTVSQPLNNVLNIIFAYLPKIGAALGLLIIAWVLASLAKMGISKASEAANVDERLNALDDEGSDKNNVSESLATAGYWLIFLLFLPIILSTLGMESLVQPLQDMLSKMLTYLPNIIKAVAVFFVGMFVARMVRKILTSFAAAAGADEVAERAGMTQSLSKLIGTLAFTFISLLVIVQSLNALNIESIAYPAQRMIDLIFTAVPGLVSAGLVLWIASYIGKLIAGVVTDLLTAAGFNGVTDSLGIKMGVEKTPSEYVGRLVLFGVILFAILAATELLGFAPLSNLVTALIGFTVQVVLGALILGIGVVLANKVQALIVGAGVSGAAGNLAKVAILVLATAMALRQIGLAEDIINLAFGLLLGAIAIGAAIAIGLGSREIAAREVEALVDRMRSKK